MEHSFLDLVDPFHQDCVNHQPDPNDQPESPVETQQVATLQKERLMQTIQLKSKKDDQSGLFGHPFQKYGTKNQPEAQTAQQAESPKRAFLEPKMQLIWKKADQLGSLGSGETLLSIKGSWGIGETLLSIKNENSFVIAKYQGEAIFVENGKKIFVDHTRSPGTLSGYIKSIQYYKPLDCYFLANTGILCRKDLLEDKPPPPFCPYTIVKIGSKPVSADSILSSDAHNCLLLHKDREKVTVYNPLKNRIEIGLKQKFSSGVSDSKLFGEARNRVIFLSRDGVVTLLNLSIVYKKILSLTQFKLSLGIEMELRYYSVSVCPRSQLAVFTSSGRASKTVNNQDETGPEMTCGVLAVLKIGSNSVSRVALKIEYGADVFKSLDIVEILGYRGEKLLFFVGSTQSEIRNLRFYEYDPEKGDVFLAKDGLDYEPEVEEPSKGSWFERFDAGESKIIRRSKFERVGDNFYSGEDCGDVLRLSFDLGDEGVNSKVLEACDEGIDLLAS